MAPAGMEDVVAGESAITWIDGIGGQLRYRGYSIGELAERCSFEEVAYLLWDGELPNEHELAGLRDELRSVRVESERFLPLLPDIPRKAYPLDVLRYVVSWDALSNTQVLDNSLEANLAKSRAFTAWFIVVAAAFHRMVSGLEPVAPRPDLDTAANFLYMMRGEEASEVEVRTLDTSLVLHADHELNASTFAARVTIATQSNMHAAIASALGTLSGPRHGGASDRVITMLEDIGSADNVEAWVRGQLDHKQRIMGFGHRVYRTVDPRSRHLRIMAEQLLAHTDEAAWIDILEKLGHVMERERHLYPNVDLYAALVNHKLGIRPSFYTSIFACTRVVGWTAHVIEQLDGRMIRPVAEYVGPGPRSMSRAGTTV
ncbi:MAG: citrate/2-methylcitrate synthase [Chloroflexota bacterium]|nr:MAG: citrate synthase [Chloroflexota bacterium]